METEKSVEVRDSILAALREEKAPQSTRVMKTVVGALFFCVACLGFLFVLWRNVLELSMVFVCSGAWTFLVLCGIWLYLKPQPRLEVRGYWSVASLAKFLVVTTCVSSLEFVLCPHFAVVHFEASHPFAIINSMIAHYMEWGGMAGCMFLCGLTFSLLSYAFGFVFLWKQVSLSRNRDLLKLFALSLLAQVPVWAFQLMSSRSTYYFSLWLAGTFSAVLLVFAASRLRMCFGNSKLNMH